MDDDRGRTADEQDVQAPEPYEPPAVEDLDTTFGPSVTAAGYAPPER